MLGWMPAQPPRRLLLLGAHCDDIEIGCGGTLLRLARALPQLSVRWVVFSGDTRRAEETRAAAALLLPGVTDLQVVVETFEDGLLSVQLRSLKRSLEALKSGFAPDLVFTHAACDAHQDHRVIHELTWCCFRDQMILEYEVPKFDGDLGRPQVYVPLTQAELGRKVEVLMQVFASQRDKPWFTASTFEALARLRGVECRAQAGWAEAFYVRKLPIAFAAEPQASWTPEASWT